MGLEAYFQPKFIYNHLWKKTVDLYTDTLNVGLIATSGLAARGTTEGYEFVSDLLANGGTALTEVSTSGTGYARQSLTDVTIDLNALVVELTATSPEWNPATFNAYYAWLHDETASSGTDATRPLLMIWDLGGEQSPSAQPFILQVNASGIFTDTMAQ